ncbi:hypothetical protein ACFSX9_05635 [Flavobacterium ardleyense]|uniref:Uncharacterized protein n=1 Tax=Flavobacterium ardleyense TaxID=2038737 RepID=A0ABW5Z640_9FLAO
MFQKSIALLFFAFFMGKIAFSQQPILAAKTNSINLPTETFLGFDNQQNFYSLKENVLSKTNKDQNFEYKNVSLGKITKVDFQNPLQIVVFYKNFNSVVLLDNQFNEIKKIDFNLQNNPINAEAVALSSQNQLWIYDGITSKIGLYSLTTGATKSISTTLDHPVTKYHSTYTHFYWFDSTNNFYSISIYGTIESLGVFPTFETIQLINEQVALYRFENQLYYYEIKIKQAHKIKIATNLVENFFFADGILAIFTQNEITNYKIILP